MCDSIRLELRSSGVGVGSAHPTFLQDAALWTHVHRTQPATSRGGGNAKGIWKMVPLQLVVGEIANGIETAFGQDRGPKNLMLTANAPGLFRRIVERIGFRDSSIQKAVELASPSGWNDREAALVSAGRANSLDQD